MRRRDEGVKRRRRKRKEREKGEDENVTGPLDREAASQFRVSRLVTSLTEHQLKHSCLNSESSMH